MHHTLINACMIHVYITFNAVGILIRVTPYLHLSCGLVGVINSTDCVLYMLLTNPLCDAWVDNVLVVGA